MASWYLIDTYGNTAMTLAGRPQTIQEGYTLRCEETIQNSAGYGDFYVTLEGTDVVGTLQMEAGLTRIYHRIEVTGTNIQGIEKVRALLRQRIHVPTEVIK